MMEAGRGGKTLLGVLLVAIGCWSPPVSTSGWRRPWSMPRPPG